MEWQDVSVFISSTFSDMHAERDLLLKKVFPELSEWCARRRLRLYDIDLRWGITAVDSENSNTVEVCLRNVDRCRPFFLCFLGQRRGWVPEEVNPETYHSFPGLAGRVGSRSVTEMEVEHALLAPMVSLVNGKNGIPEAARRSLFFIRDDAYLKDLDEAQRRIYTNAAEKDEKQADRKHADFIARVRQAWSAVWDYTCRFDQTLRTEELREAGEECVRGRLTDFMIGGEPLDRFVLHALQQQILDDFPDRTQEIGGEAEEPEAERQERRAEEVRHGTVEREELTRQLTDYCQRPAGRILWVHGRAGSGKTTLLSWFYRKHAGGFDRCCLRFCGVTPASSRWGELWRGILEETGVDPGNETEFTANLASFLRSMAEGSRTLIMIDGADELQEGLAPLAYLPSVLPDGLCLIISFRSDAKEASALLEHLKTVPGAETCEVLPLAGEEEIKKLIRSYLEHYLKALDDDQVRAICKTPAAGNPLYLKILLRELRTFGTFERIGEQIASFGGTPESAFSKMLADLENEISYNQIPAEVFVPRLLGVLAWVRGGISLPSLRQVLGSLLPGMEGAVSDTLPYYLRRLEPYLSTAGGRLAISYQTLRESALARFAALAKEQHGALAAAFREEEPLECLYHYRMAENGTEIAELTEDIVFLCGVIRVSGAPALLAELRTAVGNGLPVCREVLDCLEQTAPLIRRNRRTAAALFYKELEKPILRERAAEACDGPWLRYEPISIDVPEDPEPGAFRTLFSVENTGCEEFCIAREKGIAWILRGRADITACSLAEGTEGPVFTLPLSGLVRKIACSPDGTLLAASGEDSTLTVFRVALDESLRMLALTPVVQDTCASVRFDGVCLFSAPAGILWQRPDGTVICYAGADTQPVTVFTAQDRLTGFFEGCTVWKGGGSRSILTDGGVRVEAPAKVNDALLHGGILFLAAEDRMLTLLDPQTGRVAARHPVPAESLASLAVCGGDVYAADRYGSMIRFRDGCVENLGRITQGDNVIDPGTKLAALPDGRLGYVSQERRAVLSTAQEKRHARLLRFWPSVGGASLLWGTSRGMTAVFPDGRTVSAEYPRLILSRNVNEINNLRVACSSRTLLYETAHEVLRVLSPEQDFTVPLGEGTGEVRELCWVPENGTFQAVTGHARFLEISGRLDSVSRVDMARSDGGTYLICPCGRRTAVLSRRVQILDEGAYSMYYVDVLTMIENGRVLWKKNLLRRETHVDGLLYDRTKDRLGLFFHINRIELLSPLTGESLGEREFPVVQFVNGAAMRDSLVWCMGGLNGEFRLTARSLETGEELSLPSQHRVRRIEEGSGGIYVQEGNERLFLVSPEKGNKRLGDNK